MEKILCHVDQENHIVVNCPSCEKTTRVSVSNYKNKKHTLAVRCKCKHRFELQLNFRRYYRKSVDFAGEVLIAPRNNPGIRKRIHVSDLSMSGLRFKLIDPVHLKKDDVVRVKFDLATKHPTTIDKEAVVRFVGNDQYGCEFKDLDLEEKELGFFLFAR